MQTPTPPGRAGPMAGSRGRDDLANITAELERGLDILLTGLATTLTPQPA